MKKIQRGCPPYEGNEPYLYFCFAEKDRDAVFPLLEHLYLRGVRIWYNVEKTDNIRKLNRQLERIHLCEMKFSIHEYLIDKAYEQTLREKVGAFREITKCRESVFVTMITTYGVARNQHSYLIQSQVTLDDLFSGN